MNYRAIIASFLAPFAIFAFTAVAFAQSGGVLTLRPSKVELVVAPGERVETVITLENGTPSPVVVSVVFEDVEPISVVGVSDDPAILLGEKSGTYPLREWMRTSAKEYLIPTGETKSIPVTVEVPPGTLPGGRYGSAVIVARPSVALSSPGGENLAFETRIAALYYVRVSGNAKEEGGLRSFGISGGRFVVSPSSEAPVNFFVSYENSGDVHLNPYGGVRIKGLYGREHILPIDPWAVYPKSTRTRDVALVEALAPGYYRATLELNRGYADIVDTANTWFVVLPSFRMTAFSIILLLALGLLVRKSLRLSRNHVA
jgi:hypothetical protein